MDKGICDTSIISTTLDCGKQNVNEIKCKLSVSILISNNYENVKRCLDSVVPLLEEVDSELILTDTGCDEKIRELLEEYTDNIIDFEWCKDFSAARNVGLKKATGEWFIYLDDDEWFEDVKPIVDFLHSTKSKDVNVAFYRQRNYYLNESGLYQDYYVDRLLRVDPDLHFENRIHEAYAGIEIGEKYCIDTYVHHYGYVYKNENEKIKKVKRNQELLELECNENPNNMRLRYQLVINPMSIEKWDETIRLAEEAICISSDSEYWDACHNALLLALEKKNDWERIIQQGESFREKNIYPYDMFGILEKLVKAYWNTGQFDKVCEIAEDIIVIYTEYKKNPDYFNQQQLMRMEFLQEDEIISLLTNCITAAIVVENEEILVKFSSGAFAEEVKKLYLMPDVVEWMENVTSTLKGNAVNDSDIEVANMKEKNMIEELHFDKSYFDGETREGFYIEPMMKAAWAAQLEILNKIDKLCQMYDIAYFADWGTLLGAVRHKGFIPWDDDIDICMSRSDMRRFLALIDEGKTDLIYMNNYNDPNWGPHAIKVMNTTEFKIDREFIKEYHGFPFTAGVDLFVLDYVPRDKKLEEEQYHVLSLSAQARHLKIDMEELPKTSKKYIDAVAYLRKLLDEIQKICGIEFSQSNPTEQELLILEDEISAIYTEEESDFLTEVPCIASGQDYYISKDAYSESLRLPFENISICVPKGFEELLTKKYGTDYMTPVNKAAGHDYPFYGSLIKALSELRGEEVLETDNYVKNISVNYYIEFLKQKSEPSIEYDDNYFEEEEREGVVVSEEIKRVWAAQNEVLEEVKRICSNNGYKLFAIGDTLRDAVNNNEYGANACDLHLAMLREDYVDFMNNIQESLGPWFNYYSVYSNNEHEDIRTYIITDGMYVREEAYAKRFHGCPHIVGVDIAVLDKVNPDISKEEIRLDIIQGLFATANNVSKEPPYSQAEMSIVEDWKNIANVTIDVEKNLRREFVKAADVFLSQYRDEAEYLRMNSDMQNRIEKKYKKEWFDDVTEISFGNTMLPVPIGYEELIVEH